MFIFCGCHKFLKLRISQELLNLNLQKEKHANSNTCHISSRSCGFLLQLLPNEPISTKTASALFALFLSIVLLSIVLLNFPKIHRRDFLFQKYFSSSSSIGSIGWVGFYFTLLSISLSSSKSIVSKLHRLLCATKKNQ